MIGQELAGRIGDLVKGEDGYAVFGTLVGICLNLYDTAPDDVQQQLTKSVISMLRGGLGVKIEKIVYEREEPRD